VTVVATFFLETVYINWQICYSSYLHPDNFLQMLVSIMQVE